MSIVYNEMLQKKQQMEKLAQQGKRKYEYDSDEDVDVRNCLLCLFHRFKRGENLGSLNMSYE